MVMRFFPDDDLLYAGYMTVTNTGERILKLRAIHSVGGCAAGDSVFSYEVALSEDEREYKFLFRVDVGHIDVVQWSSDFRVFVGADTKPFQRLFEAVRAFHNANVLRMATASTTS